MIELVAVLPAVGIITTVVASALVVVTRSATMPPGQRGDAFAGAKAAGRMARDLSLSLSFPQLTPTTVEFRVPDRTGNGSEDVISYSWSGTPGDPLLYKLNKQDAEIVVEGVEHLVFTPEVITDTLDPLDEELAVIAFHDQAPESHTHTHDIEPSKWCAQYFEPVLPGGTTKWTIKRIRFMAARDGDDTSGVLGVRIEGVTLGQLPSGVVLEQARVAESSLDKEPGWVEVDFTSLNDLKPTDEFCLVLSHEAGTGKAARVTYEHGGAPMTAGSHWLKTSDAGSSWSGIVNDKDMRFYVLGTYDTWTPSAPQYVAGVLIEIQSGPSTAARVERVARVVNVVEFDP